MKFTVAFLIFAACAVAQQKSVVEISYDKFDDTTSIKSGGLLVNPFLALASYTCHGNTNGHVKKGPARQHPSQPSRAPGTSGGKVREALRIERIPATDGSSTFR
jgi:hypothetical protein